MVPSENLMYILLPRGKFSWSATAVVSAVSGVWILCFMDLSRNELPVCKGVIHLQGLGKVTCGHKSVRNEFNIDLINVSPTLTK